MAGLAALLGGVLVLPAQAQVVGSPGLVATYYRGYFYDSLQFFATHSPAITNRPIEQLNFVEAETDNFNVGSVATYYSPGNPDEFSGCFQGQLYIFTPGQYTFYLGSDDAAYLWLDGARQPVAANKGDQFPYRETTGSCTLSAGLHTLRVDYGEHGGSQGLVLQYSGPGLPKQLLPNGVLYRQAAVAILPTLSQLTATATAQQQVQLAWATTAETNSQAFVVQRSADGVAFQDINRQPSAASAPHNYELLDKYPIIGQSFYRLQQWRSDRAPVYSPIVAVEVRPVPFTVSVYPVPNDGTFYVQALPASQLPARLKLLDITGNLMYEQPLDLSDGKPQLIQPAQAVGIYKLYLTAGDNKFTQKISIGN